MDTLEQRKAKFRENMEKAEQFEDDEEFLPAIKHYREALKYSLHKKDTDHIQAKLQKLKNMAHYVSGMLEEGQAEKSGKKPWLWIIAGGLGLLALGLTLFFVLKPF
ncbi:MAG: hypothetical protein IV090_25630 [Candidatus Sericytochromatia bacterium]|nr:hypothetical protein [Candidatus Sericytochromatia bacterium]